MQLSKVDRIKTGGQSVWKRFGSRFCKSVRSSDRKDRGKWGNSRNANTTNQKETHVRPNPTTMDKTAAIVEVGILQLFVTVFLKIKQKKPVIKKAVPNRIRQSGQPFDSSPYHCHNNHCGIYRYYVDRF